jgi:hypothetical protein
MNRDKSSDGRGFLLNLCRISSGHPRGCPIGGRIGPGVGRHEACPYVAVSGWLQTRGRVPDPFLLVFRAGGGWDRRGGAKVYVLCLGSTTAGRGHPPPLENP